MGYHFASEPRYFSTTNQVPSDCGKKRCRDSQRPAQGHTALTTCPKQIEVKTIFIFPKGANDSDQKHLKFFLGTWVPRDKKKVFRR